MSPSRAYLAPTLVMGLVTTFLVIGIGAEIGRRVGTMPAAVHPDPAGPQAPAGSTVGASDPI